tara:strand:- start:13198 stop:13656 length:459 start_codon:yes stop_codon:yes gene_type:complete
MYFNLSGFVSLEDGATKEEFIENFNLELNNDITILINKAKFIFNKVNASTMVKVLLDTTVQLLCDRCLNTYEHFETSNFYAAIIFNNMKQKEISESEDGELLIKTNPEQVDLSEIIRQHIISIKPMKSLCEEDCKGLCDVCGVNLNNSSCLC